MRRRGSWRRCAGAATETAGVVEVVSCGFAPLSADPLGAGTAFDVKCLWAINSIAAVIELTVQRVDCELIFSFPIGPAYCSDADPDWSRRKLRMTANVGYRGAAADRWRSGVCGERRGRARGDDTGS